MTMGLADDEDVVIAENLDVMLQSWSKAFPKLLIFEHLHRIGVLWPHLHVEVELAQGVEGLAHILGLGQELHVVLDVLEIVFDLVLLELLHAGQLGKGRQLHGVHHVQQHAHVAASFGEKALYLRLFYLAHGIELVVTRVRERCFRLVAGPPAHKGQWNQSRQEQKCHQFRLHPQIVQTEHGIPLGTTIALWNPDSDVPQCIPEVSLMARTKRFVFKQFR